MKPTPNTSATFYRVARNHVETARFYRDKARHAWKLTPVERRHSHSLSADWFRSAMEYRQLARKLHRQEIADALLLNGPVRFAVVMRLTECFELGDVWRWLHRAAHSLRYEL